MSFDNRRSTMEGGTTGGASATDVQSQASVSLCKTGCGFYANAAFEGMCSKCYKEDQLRSQQQQQDLVTAAVQQQQQQIAAATAVNQNDCINEMQCTAAAVNSEILPASASTDFQEATSSENVGSVSAAIADEITSNSDTTLAQSVETGTPTVHIANIPHNDSSSSDISMSEESNLDKAGSEGKKKNRCHVCKKRVGLTGFECRCGGLYCSVHRYSDKHDCSFDYKELAQDQIRKNNPVVVGEKIKKL